MGIEQVIYNLYDKKVAAIKEANIKLEREYFEANKDQIPYSGLLEGSSYCEIFSDFKNCVKKGTKEEIDQIFTLLQEYFLFSSNNDLTFKKKLEADSFNSEPLTNLIYPLIIEEVSKKYNDVSVWSENSGSKENITDIEKIIDTYVDLSSLLYLFYYHDFEFPQKWEEFFPNSYIDLFEILNIREITVEKLLHSILNYKCQIIIDILSKIENPDLRLRYFIQINHLKQQEEAKINQCPYLHYSIFHFFNPDFKTSLIEESPKKF